MAKTICPPVLCGKHKTIINIHKIIIKGIYWNAFHISVYVRGNGKMTILAQESQNEIFIVSNKRTIQ